MLPYVFIKSRVPYASGFLPCLISRSLIASIINSCWVLPVSAANIFNSLTPAGSIYAFIGFLFCLLAWTILLGVVAFSFVTSSLAWCESSPMVFLSATANGFGLGMGLQPLVLLDY